MWCRISRWEGLGYVPCLGLICINLLECVTLLKSVIYYQNPMRGIRFVWSRGRCENISLYVVLGSNTLRSSSLGGAFLTWDLVDSTIS